MFKFSHKPQNYLNKNCMNLFEDNRQSVFKFTSIPEKEYLYYGFFTNPAADSFELQSNHSRQSEYNDVIIRNAYPLAKYHMLFLPFFEKNYPQYINSKDIIERVINIFDYFTNSDNKDTNENLVMAYNSKGASSSINSLHFQMFILSEFNMTIDDLYIRKNNFFDEQILINLKQQTDSEKIQINFCKKDKLCACFRIRLGDDFLISQCENKQNFISNFAKIIYKIIKVLNKENIPHNLILLQKEVFIFVRKHQNLLRNSWLGSNELLGFVLVYTEEDYNSYNTLSIIESFRCSMLSDEILNDILKKVNFCFNKNVN